MAFKKKLVTHKYEGEYESPDGEIYDCIAVHSGDRCYVQWRLQNTEKENDWTTVDGAMLEGLFDWYLDMTGKSRSSAQSRPRPQGLVGRLKKPLIIDHRDPQGTEIHNKVSETMKNYDDDVKPIESFSQQSSPENVWDGEKGTAIMRTGLDPSIATQKAPETPEPWKINEDSDTGWKSEAKSRKNMPKPTYIAKGSIGERVKRVRAGDIV